MKPNRPVRIKWAIFPVIAVARAVGWVAHWKEMIADHETRLFRPRQLYTGSGERPLVPLAQRTADRPLVGSEERVRDDEKD
jgi:citrate synthase